MALWPNLTLHVACFWPGRDRNTRGDERWPESSSLICDVRMAADDFVHYDLTDINHLKMCPIQGYSWNSFDPWKSCVLVHTVTDLPHLAWQQQASSPPTPRRPGWEIMAQNPAPSTLTKIFRGKPLWNSTRSTDVLYTVRLHSQGSRSDPDPGQHSWEEVISGKGGRRNVQILLHKDIKSLWQTAVKGGITHGPATEWWTHDFSLINGRSNFIRAII